MGHKITQKSHEKPLSAESVGGHRIRSKRQPRWKMEQSAFFWRRHLLLPLEAAGSFRAKFIITKNPSVISSSSHYPEKRKQITAPTTAPPPPLPHRHGGRCNSLRRDHCARSRPPPRSSAFPARAHGFLFCRRRRRLRRPSLPLPIVLRRLRRRRYPPSPARGGAGSSLSAPSSASTAAPAGARLQLGNEGAGARGGRRPGRPPLLRPHALRHKRRRPAQRALLQHAPQRARGGRPRGGGPQGVRRNARGGRGAQRVILQHPCQAVRVADRRVPSRLRRDPRHAAPRVGARRRHLLHARHGAVPCGEA